MRVKDTLNLGKTKFPMRGNLPVREAERQKAWEENKVYERRQKLNEVRPTSIGQAIRISGVNPSDIAILNVYLKKEYHESR